MAHINWTFISSFIRTLLDSNKVTAIEWFEIDQPHDFGDCGLISLMRSYCRRKRSYTVKKKSATSSREQVNVKSITSWSDKDYPVFNPWKIFLEKYVNIQPCINNIVFSNIHLYWYLYRMDIERHCHYYVTLFCLHLLCLEVAMLKIRFMD